MGGLLFVLLVCPCLCILHYFDKEQSNCFICKINSICSINICDWRSVFSTPASHYLYSRLEYESVSLIFKWGNVRSGRAPFRLWNKCSLLESARAGPHHRMQTKYPPWSPSKRHQEDCIINASLPSEAACYLCAIFSRTLTSTCRGGWIC